MFDLSGKNNIGCSSHYSTQALLTKVLG